MKKTLLGSTALFIGYSSATGDPVTVGGNFSTSTSTVTNAAVPHTTSDMLSRYYEAPPLTHTSLWHPAPAGQSYDTSGAYFAPVRKGTAVFSFETPFNATSAQLWVANNGGTAFTLTNAAISSSSQWSAPGDTSGLPGISAFDQNGKTLTAMPLVDFGSCGADSSPNSGQLTSIAPCSSTSTMTGATSTSQTMLSFGGRGACPPNGSIVESLGNAGGQRPLFYPETWVISCSSSAGTIVINRKPFNAVPVGAVVEFKRPGIIVAASPAQPEYTIDKSSWVSLDNYGARRDGPVMAGMTLLQNGLPLVSSAGSNITVSSTTPSSALLSAGLRKYLPAQSILQACQAGTLSSVVKPNYTMSFATPTTGSIVAGETIIPAVSSNIWTWPAADTIESISVAGTTTTVTNSQPDWGQGGTGPGSGTAFLFLTPHVVQAGSTSRTIILDSATNLTTGMQAYQGGGQGSIQGTIISINGNVVTVSRNSGITPPPGMRVNFAFQATLNSPTSVPEFHFVAPAPSNLRDGMRLVGPSIPAADLAANFHGGSYLDQTQSSTGTIAAGSTIYVCNDLITSAGVEAGSASIPFKSTLWPNHLISVRLNFGSAGAGFFAQTSQQRAVWNSMAGVPSQMGPAITCASGVDGVLNVPSVSSIKGSCHVSNFYPAFAVRVYSHTMGYQFAAVSTDSHGEGDTTPYWMPFPIQAAALINNPPALPVSSYDAGYGGKSSFVFAPFGSQVAAGAGPTVAFIQYTTPNNGCSVGWTNNLSCLQNMTHAAARVASEINLAGGMAWLWPDYQRQKYGVTVDSIPSNETFRLLGEATLLAGSASGLPVVDAPSYLGDPVNGSVWFAPSFSDDGIHANFAGHKAIAVGTATQFCLRVRC